MGDDVSAAAAGEVGEIDEEAGAEVLAEVAEEMEDSPAPACCMLCLLKTSSVLT